MRAGHQAGLADARHADAVVTALGMPGVPVYFAADWDAGQADQPAISAYLDGAASVIGRRRTGIYGGCHRSGGRSTRAGHLRVADRGVVGRRVGSAAGATPRSASACGWGARQLCR